MKRLVNWLNASEDRRLWLVLFGLLLLVYVPLTGNYGMWDPWETHYGEVARQMLERGDFISQWWPGSPQDRAEFWSKPVLTFWVMAIGMKLLGIEWSSDPAQIASSWRAEWGARLPIVACGLVGLWAVWELTRRLAGRRAALLSTLVLGTASQWLLITRQAMTDMVFVAPMTAALALGGLGLLLPEDERRAELPRGSLRLGRWTLTYPRDRAFAGFVSLFALSTLPQLVMISIQLRLSFRLGDMQVTTIGLVPMLPYVAAFVAALWWCARARNRQQLYLFCAWVLCGLASLAKGPAGLALPAIVLGVYLVVAGRWKEILTGLEIPRGVLLFVVTSFPWYHAMLIRHGMGFWNEFIGDNYVNRAGGRHGDRGTFEYYIQYIAYGLFPWSGLTVAGLGVWLRRARDLGPKGRLTLFAIVWALVEFSIMSLVNTKFHHYILPALPALAIVTGLFLDELVTAPRRYLVEVLLIALPITLLSGRDLAAFPPRILWLFNYDYVNAPGTGRPWPLVSLYGDRYEYGSQLLVFAAAAALLTAALVLLARRATSATPPASALIAPPTTEPPASDDPSAPAPATATAAASIAPPAGSPATAGNVLLAGGVFLLLLVVGVASGPASPGGAAPVLGRWAWLLPALVMLAFVPFVARAEAHSSLADARPGEPATDRRVRLGLWAFIGLSVVWSAFLLDKILVELSPHWSQKHVIAAYYRERQSADEPLIAWQLYWRGENFYTRNSIYNSTTPTERTVFVGDRNAEKLQQYLLSHTGRRVFFVVERARWEALKNLVPEKFRASLKIIEESNNKLYLATAQL